MLLYSLHSTIYNNKQATVYWYNPVIVNYSGIVNILIKSTFPVIPSASNEYNAKEARYFKLSKVIKKVRKNCLWVLPNIRLITFCANQEFFSVKICFCNFLVPYTILDFMLYISFIEGKHYIHDISTASPYYLLLICKARYS